MRSRRSIDGRAQASLESILLWAGFLSVLGLFLPVFNQAIEVQQLQVEKERFVHFSDALSHLLHATAFHAPGSSASISSPALEGLEISMEGHSLELSWSPASLNNGLVRTIDSPLELDGSISPDFKTLIIRRESDVIIVESG